MQTKTELSEMDIKMAIAAYVKDKTGKPVNANAVIVHYHNFDNSSDPRERSYLTASVTHSDKSSIG